MRTYIFTTLFIIVSQIGSIAASQNDTLKFYIDLSILEHPYNFKSKYSTASMDQSIQLTKSFYYSSHFGIALFGEKYFGKNGGFWSKVLMSIFDFAPLPLSNTWLHEEYHRSILSLHDIKSKNGHWTSSVKGINDEDLISFKSTHPADLVREATAGNEGNLEFVFSIEKDVFFEEVTTWNYGLYWGNYLVNSFYLFGSTREGSNLLVNYKNNESTDIHQRDANGFDPINATYDLFNPFEPYTSRGIHPSGVGIDRYVEFNDLTLDAQQFLQTQFKLSFLNFVDLNLFGIDSFGKEVKFNFSMRHHMTSFGHMIGGNLFFKTEMFGGVISPKIYKNRSQSLFGIDMEVRNNWGKITLGIWEQPKNQLYDDLQKQIGGRCQLILSPPFKNFKPYINFSFKTDGWVAANPYLENNFTMSIGGRWSFHSL